MRERRVRRLLAALLAVYPRDFRWDIGADLLETALARWRDARKSGRGSEVRYWLTDGVRFALDGLLERARSVFSAAAAEGGHAWRRVRRAPGQYVLAAATIALGVAATTTVFTVADAVVFRPLPYPAAEELYLVHTRFGALELSSNSLPNLRTLERAVPSLEWLAGAADRSPALADAAGPAERVSVVDVTERYLPELGARVVVGRGFAPADYAAGAERTAIVSHGLWQRRWGGRQDLVGRAIRLDGAAYTVIGVMDPSFRDPEPIESGATTAAWTPARGASGSYRHRDNYAFRLIGRIGASTAPAVVRQQLATAGGALSEAYPEANRLDGEPMDFVLHGLRDATIGEARGRVLLLLGAVLLLLLLACANVANLFLARGLTRAPELSLRGALGAVRARLGAQLFAESLLTAVVASLAGAALAVMCLPAFLAAAPAGLPRLHEVGIDSRALGFIVLLTVGTAVFFGSVPALRGARTAHSVGSAARSTSSRDTRRFQSVLLGLEVALSLVLLTGSALLLNSFRHLLRVDPGFDAEDVLVVDVRPPLQATSHEQALLFYRTLLERVATLPGVRRAGLVYTPPGVAGGAWSRVTTEDGADLAGSSARPRAPARGIAPGDDFVRLNPVYGPAFLTLGMRLIAGRGFDGEPDAGDPPVVVINAAAARRLFPESGQAVGRRIALGPPGAGAPLREIVGIVRDVRQSGAAREPDAQIYLPYGQRDIDRMSLVLKAEPGAAIGGEAIRRLVHEVAPGLPVDRVDALSTRYAATAEQARFLAFLLTLFAAFGVILAMVGTYAMAAQTMTRRVRELGVRIALGARVGSVFGLVLARVLLIIGAGVAAGLPLALALTRFLDGYVFGIGPRDPLTFGFAGIFIALSAAVASMGPALRATRIDPNDVLRAD